MSLFTKSEIKKVAAIKKDISLLTSDCMNCGLYKNKSKYQNTKIKVAGEGKKKILIIGDYVTETDEELGTSFTGEEGKQLTKYLSDNKIQLQRDCWRVKAVRCECEKPTYKQIRACFPYIEKFIKEKKPKLILAFGTFVISALFGEDYSDRDELKWRGLCIPDQEFKCNIVPLFPITKLIENDKDKNLKCCFERDLKFAIESLKTPFIEQSDHEQCVTMLKNFKTLKSTLQKVLKKKPLITYDYETTGKKPFKEGHKIVTISFSVSEKRAYSFPYQYRDFWTEKEQKKIHDLWQKILKDPKIKKIAHNCFSGTTNYITKEGLKSFKETENTKQIVWTKKGWKEAEIKCFGEDYLSKIIVGPANRSRSNIQREIYSTENHRWIVIRRFQRNNKPAIFREIEVTTDQLKLRDKIICKLPKVIINKNTDAFRHGLIFADGTKCSNRLHAFQIRLCGKKEKYKSIFPKYTYPPSANGDPVVNWYKDAVDLKKVPQNVSAEYMANFIAGWNAGDGTNATAGNSRVITTFDKEAAYWLKENSSLGGWVCTGFSEHIQKPNKFCKKEARPYWMIIITKEEINWSVKSIQHKVKREKVYCATLQEDEFTLQYGIYTRNSKFEEIWGAVFFKARHKWHFDTLMCAHILDNRHGYTGLKFQTFIKFGIRPYDKEISKYLKTKGEFNTIEKAPLKDLLLYNGLDCIYTHMIYKQDIETITSQRGLLRAYNFFIEGNKEMASLQLNGFMMDVKHYIKTKKFLTNKIKKIEKRLLEGREARAFKKKYGRNLLLTSNQDLGKLFYEVLGKEPFYTSNDNYKTDKKTLEKLNLPFINKLFEKKKYEKALGTYLGQFEREICKNKIHPFYDLIFPLSYRSSSSGPNMQNQPKRDEEIKKLIRLGLIPRKKSVLSEIDFSGSEVIASASCHKDPNFIAYLLDKSTDMHRDNATDLLLLPHEMLERTDYNKEQKKKVKLIRFYAKNLWTFAQFYGDWYGSCAPNFWEVVIEGGLLLPDGTTCKDWLASQGIYELGEFENGRPTPGSFLEHCQKVEDKMWNQRFPDYTQWKKDIVKFYQKYGYIESLFGFKFIGYMTRNQCTNFPVQSASFHLLLYTLIETQKMIKRLKLKTKLIGQVHDSILANVPVDEVKIYHREVHKIVQSLQTKFKWLVVPMEIEAEISKTREEGGSLADMQEVDPDNAKIWH